MAKLVLNDLANLQSETTAIQTINANGEAIVEAMENTLSRDGTTPNTMSANLDMNSNRILNLPEPTTAGEPLRLSDVGGILPSEIAAAGAAALAAGVYADEAAASAVEAAGYVGSALQAPKWTTSRTITMSGDITSVSPYWDGSTDLAWTGVAITAGSVTASKLASGAALTNLGYTPANLTGAVFTGDVRLNFTATSLSADSAGFRGIPIGTHDATYTFVVDDMGRLKRHTSGSAHTWTINPNSITAFPIGAAISVRNVGAGAVTLARGAGVSLRKSGSATDADVTVSQWALATLVQEALDVWVITGTGIS